MTSTAPRSVSESERASFNLQVLRRRDPLIADIDLTSSHVSVYSLDEDTSAWTRAGIEGAVFLLRRTAQPLYQLLVLNKLGLNDLQEPLFPDMDVQLLDSVLMFRTVTGKVLGLWIYDRELGPRLEARMLQRRTQSFPVAWSAPLSSSVAAVSSAPAASAAVFTPATLSTPASGVLSPPSSRRPLPSMLPSMGEGMVVSSSQVEAVFSPKTIMSTLESSQHRPEGQHLLGLLQRAAAAPAPAPPSSSALPFDALLVALRHPSVHAALQEAAQRERAAGREPAAAGTKVMLRTALLALLHSDSVMSALLAQYEVAGGR